MWRHHRRKRRRKRATHGWAGEDRYQVITLREIVPPASPNAVERERSDIGLRGHKCCLVLVPLAPTNHSDNRRLAKYASVPTPIHNAKPPVLSPSLRSFTTSTGCGAPFTYSRAFTPLTSTLIFVHSPGTMSTYDSYCPAAS